MTCVVLIKDFEQKLEWISLQSDLLKFNRNVT